MRWFLRSKIHNATVTDARVEYVGSIALDEDLMDAAGLMVHEKVLVADTTDGARVETYVIPGERGSGVVCINGAAAHLVNPGDLVIIVAYEGVPSDQADTHHPRIVHVDEHNRIVSPEVDPERAAHANIEEQITVGSR